MRSGSSNKTGRCWIKDVQVGLVWAIVIGLGMVAPAPAELVDRVVAVVNNDIILQSELVQALFPIREKIKQEGYSEAEQEEILSQQRPRMLEQMIIEKLTDQQAEKYKIQIGESEVDATIERIKQVNGFSDERLRQMLALEGLNSETYRIKIKEQLLRTKLVNLEVKSKIVVTDSDVKAAYEKNQEQYSGQIQYHLRHILLKVSPDAAKGQREEVFQKMRFIHERLKAGEKFDQLAEVYSEAGTAARGGDLGYIETRVLAPQIKEGLKELKHGQFSSILDTEQGYQIFLLEEIRHAGGKTLEEVKAEIQDRLYAEIIDQKFNSWLKDLRERAHVEIME
jgi:peptidyl-prolyl cis-trans isomerase SurA